MCCKQENMSMNPKITHPDLRLVARPISEEILSRIYPPLDPGAPQHTPILPAEAESDDILFPFEALPIDIQWRILGFVFRKRSLIHCLSRLDEAQAPQNFPEDDHPRRTGLLHRFHIGRHECSVTVAPTPGRVLRPLLVCRQWLHIGVHIFYGANTFAFSSLGEFRKFMTGIGPARRQRIQHVELMWHGNLMHPGAEQIDLGNGRKWLHKVSKRTKPLVWLTDMRRLRTLVVHIAESDPKRNRRRYEMCGPEDWFKDRMYDKTKIENLETFGKMVKRTANQPNFRKFRSMRTVHGMDYLYQLRGMK